MSGDGPDSEPSVEDLTKQIQTRRDAGALKTVAAWESLVAWVRLASLLPVDGRFLYLMAKAVEVTSLENLRDHGVSELALAILDDGAWEMAQALRRRSATAGDYEELIEKAVSEFRKEFLARGGKEAGA